MRGSIVLFLLIFSTHGLCQSSGLKSTEGDKVAIEISKAHLPFFKGCRGAGNAEDRILCSQKKAQKFLDTSIVFPKILEGKNLSELVQVLIGIDPLGKLVDIELLEGKNSLFVSEVVRVLKTMPPWQQALLHNEVEDPVYFHLQYFFSEEREVTPKDENLFPNCPDCWNVKDASKIECRDSVIQEKIREGMLELGFDLASGKPYHIDVLFNRSGSFYRLFTRVSPSVDFNRALLHVCERIQLFHPKNFPNELQYPVIVHMSDTNLARYSFPKKMKFEKDSTFLSYPLVNEKPNLTFSSAQGSLALKDWMDSMRFPPNILSSLNENKLYRLEFEMLFQIDAFGYPSQINYINCADPRVILPVTCHLYSMPRWRPRILNREPLSSKMEFQFTFVVH